MFIAYFNDVAWELVNWALRERKDSKRNAIKIGRIADKLEIKHRKKHGIPLDNNIWSYQTSEYSFLSAKFPKKPRDLADKIVVFKE